MEQMTPKRKREYKSTGLAIIGALMGLIALLVAPFAWASFDFPVDTNNNGKIDGCVENGGVMIVLSGTPTTAVAIATGYGCNVFWNSTGLVTNSAVYAQGEYVLLSYDSINNYNIYCNNSGLCATGTTEQRNISHYRSYNRSYNFKVSATHYASQVVADIPPDFNAIITLPDTTVITSGYDYNGGNFGDINMQVLGDNQYGYYDTINVSVLKDDISYLTGFSSGFNVSCVGCEIANFNLSELGTFTQYHNYTFNISMTSPLTDTITKSYILGYSYTENLIDYDTCTTGDLFCYLKNAFKWAFTVPPSTFEKFTELKIQLQTKAPFGYATSAYNVINGINTTGTGTFELEQVTPITNTIFTPIRNGLTWFLYFLFIFAIIKRFKTVEL